MRELHEVFIQNIQHQLFILHIYICRSAHKIDTNVEELRNDHRFLPILQNSAMISEAGSIGVSVDKMKKWREKYEQVYHKVCDEYASLDSQHNPRLPQVHIYSHNASISLYDIECTCCPIREVGRFEGQWLCIWSGGSTL